MKAIDFACHLLARLTEDSMPLTYQQVLLSIAAGLTTASDIARFTGISACACSGILRALTNRELVQRHQGTHPSYALAPAGRTLVRQYFNFLPRP